MFPFLYAAGLLAFLSYVMGPFHIVLMIAITWLYFQVAGIYWLSETMSDGGVNDL